MKLITYPHVGEHGIIGSQFDFLELLRDRVKKLASDL